MTLASRVALLALLTVQPVLLAVTSPGAVRDSRDSVGLLVVAHGADSSWNARVEQVVREVDWTGPRAVAFLMGPAASTSGWNDAVAGLEAAGADRLVVVPLMVSSHGAHYRQVLHYAGLVDSLPTGLSGHRGSHAVRHPTVPVRVTAAVDDAPELGEIMLDRWRAAASGRVGGDLVIVAHGPGSDLDAARWVGSLEVALRPVHDALQGGRLWIGLLRDDAAPPVRARAVTAIRDTINALTHGGADSVMVMTVLVSSGLIDRVRVPADLAGTPMRYAPTVLAPHPALARWIARMAGAAH
jgi:sirohydrochlorin ferrochelatase